MHRALLIDEILQEIFDLCSEDGKGGKGTLTYIARCCKAWKDPALDRLWKVLPSVAPLLSLATVIHVSREIAPSAEVASESLNMVIFHSYAKRVKSITHRQRINTASPPSRLILQTEDDIHLLPNLTSARISMSGWGEIQTRLSVSHHLRNLQLDLGFKSKASRQDSGDVGTLACKLIHDISKNSSLERLSVRGFAAPCLIPSISFLTTLRTLSLHTSSSMTVEALMVISSLPILAELNLHAGHFADEKLAESISVWRGRGNYFFPSLEKLSVRGHAPVIELLIQNLPPNTLRALHIEVGQAAGLPSSWSAVFSRLSANTLQSLEQLTIEHDIDIDDDDDTHTSSFKSSNHYTIQDLRPLAQLDLRCFTLDTLVPPDLTDSDVEEMSRWWPNLRRLQLGDSTVLYSAGVAWRPRMTLSCLATFAARCRKLERLTLSLDASSEVSLDVTPSRLLNPHPLRRLTIGSHSPPDVIQLSGYLNNLFPSLTMVYPGQESGDTEQWQQVQANLHAQ